MADRKHPLMTTQDSRRLRDAKIRALYNTKVDGKRVYSMDSVVAEMNRIGYGVSKKTVFLAVNNKKSKRSLEKRAIRRKLKK